MVSHEYHNVLSKHVSHHSKHWIYWIYNFYTINHHKMHIQTPFGNSCWQFSETLVVDSHTPFNTLLSQMNTYFTFFFQVLSIYYIKWISWITSKTYYCEINSQFIFIWFCFIFFIIVSLSWILFCLFYFYFYFFTIFSSFCLFSYDSIILVQHW